MSADTDAIDRALRRRGWTDADIAASRRTEDERKATTAERMRQYHANVTQPDGFAVTCGKCNHTGNFDDFVKDRLGFERPENEFQCPKCGFAIRREAEQGIIKLKPIQSTL